MYILHTPVLLSIPTYPLMYFLGISQLSPSVCLGKNYYYIGTYILFIFIFLNIVSLYLGTLY